MLFKYVVWYTNIDPHIMLALYVNGSIASSMHTYTLDTIPTQIYTHIYTHHTDTYIHHIDTHPQTHRHRQTDTDLDKHTCTYTSHRHKHIDTDSDKQTQI